MELLDPNEAAEYLKVSKSTLALWRRLKQGPRFIKVGKKVKYAINDLKAFLEESTVQTKNQ